MKTLKNVYMYIFFEGQIGGFVVSGLGSSVQQNFTQFLTTKHNGDKNGLTSIYLFLWFRQEVI